MFKVRTQKLGWVEEDGVVGGIWVPGLFIEFVLLGQFLSCVLLLFMLESGGTILWDDTT